MTPAEMLRAGLPPAQVLAAIRAQIQQSTQDATTWEMPAVAGDPWFWNATPTQRLPHVDPPVLGEVGRAAMRAVCRPWPGDRRTW